MQSELRTATLNFTQRHIHDGVNTDYADMINNMNLLKQQGPYYEIRHADLSPATQYTNI